MCNSENIEISQYLQGYDRSFTFNLIFNILKTKTFMVNLLKEQKIRVNILDAETKQIIQKNFVLDTKELFVNSNFGALLKGGTGVVSMRSTPIHASVEETLELVESPVIALEYDYSSITGNVISTTYDPESGFYFYPFVVNIYMSKL